MDSKKCLRYQKGISLASTYHDGLDKIKLVRNIMLHARLVVERIWNVFALSHQPLAVAIATKEVSRDAFGASKERAILPKARIILPQLSFAPYSIRCLSTPQHKQS